MATRTLRAPAEAAEPIRSTRKALAALVDGHRLEDARPLARFILQEVAALEREGFAAPVRAADLDLCTRILDGRQSAGAIPLSPVTPA